VHWRKKWSSTQEFKRVYYNFEGSLTSLKHFNIYPHHFFPCAIKSFKELFRLGGSHDIGFRYGSCVVDMFTSCLIPLKAGVLCYITGGVFLERRNQFSTQLQSWMGINECVEQADKNDSPRKKIKNWEVNDFWYPFKTNIIVTRLVVQEGIQLNLSETLITTITLLFCNLISTIN